MFCMKCGSQIPDGAAFCSHCGQPTGSAPTPTQPASSVANVGKAVAGAVTGMANKLDEATGGSGHVTLKFKDFFINVPKHHTHEDAEALFSCGSPTTTPKLSEVSSEWPKPWLYSRVFVILLVTLIGCMALWELFHNSKSFPNIMFIGALLVPFTAVIFFFETNAPRNISIAQVVKMFFVGGILSILMIYPVSAIMPESGAGEFGPAMVTGVIEEIAKILLIVYFMSRTKGRNYVLNGLLIGASVGAGFAVFESAGYAFDSFIRYFVYGLQNTDQAAQIYGLGYQGIVNIVAIRATMAIGGHVAWAAAEGAALAICEKETGFALSQLADPRFLIVAVICIVLHGIWDTSPFLFLDDFAIPYLGSPKYILLIIIIWIVIAVMLDRGLSQINELANAESTSSEAEASADRDAVKA